LASWPLASFTPWTFPGDRDGLASGWRSARC
jgi:hypothetical protein